MTCGANAGDAASTSPGRPVRDDLALGEHHHLVGGHGGELHVVGRHHHRMPVVGERAQHRRPARPWPGSPDPRVGSSSSSTGGAPTSTTTSARASRWPSERSRGWVSSGMPGHQPVEELAGLPRAAVGGRALLGDGLEVEQVGGGLRHQPDQGAALRPAAGSRGRCRRRSTRPARALAAALQGPQQRRLAGAVAPHQRRHGAGSQAHARAPERHRRATDHGESLAHRDRRAVLPEGRAAGGRRGRGRGPAAVRRARSPAAGPSRRRAAELGDRGYDG